MSHFLNMFHLIVLLIDPAQQSISISYPFISLSQLNIDKNGGKIKAHEHKFPFTIDYVA